MLTNHTKLMYGALFLASAFLTACGGGGGGGTTAAATYTISGSITGLSAGQVIQLRNSNTDTISITGNGTGTDSFSFPKVVSGSYTVTVLSKPATLTCTLSGNPFQVNGDINSVVVTCSATTYTIGGTISGLAGTGLVLRNNGADDLPVSAGAVDFTFPTRVASGGGYAVTVSTPPTSPNQRCTVTGGGTGSGTGTNVQQNINNVAVSCLNVYAINAAVTGLGTSVGLKLQNTGSVTGTDNLSITTDGTFPFSKALAQNEHYDVKVLIQPAAPALTCTSTASVTPAFGNMPASAITVDIACQPPVPSYAYVANYNSHDISAYSIDSATGVLTSVGPAVAAGTGPQSVTVVPSGKFAYVANIDSSDISAYRIDNTPVTGTGALTQINCGGGAGCNVNNFLAGFHPVSITVDSSGRFAYVTNLNNAIPGDRGDISAYAINATSGALTQINCTGGPTVCNGNNFLAGINPSAVAVDHSGQFVYVANANDNSVSAYTIGATGALTQVLCGGSVTACGTVDPLDSATTHNGDNFLAGIGPKSLDVDPTSRFVYVANAIDNSVSAYSINAATGSLTPIDADPATAGIQNFAAGTAPTSITIDPSGKYVYVANFGSLPTIPGDISAYSIDSGTGALTQVLCGAGCNGNNFLAGTSPTSITVDLSGKFVYVANYDSANVSAYSITSGALSAIATSPYPAGTRPRSVVTTIVY